MEQTQVIYKLDIALIATPENILLQDFKHFERIINKYKHIMQYKFDILTCK